MPQVKCGDFRLRISNCETALGREQSRRPSRPQHAHSARGRLGSALLKIHNPKSASLTLAADGADGLVEDFQRNVNVLAREDERRRPAYRVVSRAEDDETAPVALH